MTICTLWAWYLRYLKRDYLEEVSLSRKRIFSCIHGKILGNLNNSKIIIESKALTITISLSQSDRENPQAFKPTFTCLNHINCSASFHVSRGPALGWPRRVVLPGESFAPPPSSCTCSVGNVTAGRVHLCCPAWAELPVPRTLGCRSAMFSWSLSARRTFAHVSFHNALRTSVRCLCILRLSFSPSPSSSATLCMRRVRSTLL